jgi:uncharacterized protein
MTVSSPILSGISCNLDTALLQASLPLFSSEKVESIEWSFDALYKTREIPDWFVELIHAYANEGRLIGHGIYFSLFSGNWTEDQQKWLDHLRKVSATFRFDHITEHFGFMTGEDFHKGAPIGVPFTLTTLRLGTDRLQRMYDACECPVGLENLAFSYSLDEVKCHGEFLEKLVEPVNGFIIFDLHNFFCQLHNFSVDPDVLMSAYPLHRVREIHISGGSWEDAQPGRFDTKVIRRDTHDNAVPAEVFELLKKVIPHCPNLKFVMLEQIGPALKTIENQQQFRDDFDQLRQVVSAFNSRKNTVAQNDFLPAEKPVLSSPVPTDNILHRQQQELSEILENAKGFEDAAQRIKRSSLADSAWKTEDWSPYMLLTAMQIAQKWKKGW